MKKIRLAAAMALLLAVTLCCAAFAEMDYDWSSTYNAYYLAYDESAVQGWSRTDYAGNEGMLLYMYDDLSEVSVSLQERSDAPTLDDLADLQLQYVNMYGELTREAKREDWYAAWEQNLPGMKLSYSYTFGRDADDMQFDVVKYLAAINDDKYLMVEVVDRSGDVDGLTARLEGGFLTKLTVDSFAVSGGTSAYLTGANEKDGSVYLTLQLFEVVKDEGSTEYSIVTGETQVLKMCDGARMLAPKTENTGILADIEISADAINSFIDGYRMANGKDCVFNLLLSGGDVRWMTYSYLY